MQEVTTRPSVSSRDSCRGNRDKGAGKPAAREAAAPRIKSVVVRCAAARVLGEPPSVELDLTEEGEG